MAIQELGLNITAIVSQASKSLNTLASQWNKIRASAQTPVTPTVNTSKAKSAFDTLIKQVEIFKQSVGQQIGKFGDILARRFAFSVATALERGLVNILKFIPNTIGAAIEEGKKFESAMVKTATVVATSMGRDVLEAVESVKKGYSDLSRVAREVGSTTVFTAQEAADAMFELASAGLTAQQVMDTLPVAADLASAAQTDLSTATDLLTQSIVSFNLTEKGTKEAADAMVLALNTSTLTVSRLTSAFRFAAPAAGAIGASIDETLVVLSRFVGVTKQGGIAGRAFRFMIQSLLNPTKKVREGLAALGLTVEDVSLKTHTLSEVLEIFRDKQLDAELASRIFGTRAGPVIASTLRQMRIELALGIDKLGAFQEALNRFDPGQIVKRQAAAFRTAVLEQFKLIRSQVTEIFLRVFEDVLPSLEIGIKKVSSALEFIIENFESVRLVLLTGISGFVLTLTGAAVSMLSAFGKLETIIKGLKGTLAILSVSMAKIFTSIVIPTALVVGISWLISLILRATGTWESFKRSVLGGANDMTAMFKHLGQTFKVFATALGLMLRDLNNLRLSIEAGADAFNLSGGRIAIMIDLLSKLKDKINEIGKDENGAGKGLVDRFTESLTQLELHSPLAAQILKIYSKYAEEAAKVVVAEERILAKERLRQESLARSAKNENLLKEALMTELDITKDINEQRADMERLLRTTQSLFTSRTQEGVDELKLVNALSDQYETLLMAREEGIIVLNDEQNAYLDKIELMLEEIKVAQDSKEAAKELLEAYEELQEKIRGFNKAELSEALQTMGMWLRDAKNGAIEFTQEGLRVALDELQNWRNILVQAGLGNSEYVKKIDEMTVALFELGDAGLEDTSIKLIEFNQELEDSLITDSALVTQIRNVSDAFESLFDGLRPDEVSTGLAKILTDIIRLGDEGLALSGVFRDKVAAELKKYVDILVKAGENTEEYASAMLFAKVIAGQLGIEFEDLADLQAKLDEVTRTTTSNSKGYWESMSEEISRGFARAIGDMIFEAESFAEFLEKLLKGLVRKIIFDVFNELITGFSNVLRGLQFAAEDAEPGVLSTFSKIFSSNAGVIGIIAGAGIVIAGIVSGWFSGTDPTKKAAELAGKNLATTISDELAEQIGQLSDEIGDTWTAVLLSTLDIIEEAGVESVGNLEIFIDRSIQLFSSAEQGFISMERAMQEYKDIILELIPRISDFGTGFERVLEGVLDVINRVNTGLLSVGEELDFLSEVLPALFQEVIETGGEGVKEVFTIIVEIFKQVQEGVLSSTQALELMEPVISGIIDNLELFGKAGVDALRMMRDAARELGFEIEAINNFFIQLATTAVEGIDQFLGVYVNDLKKARQDYKKYLRELVALYREGEITWDEMVSKYWEARDAFEAATAAAIPSQAELRLATSLLVASFKELLASGVPLIEVYDQMGQSVKDLRKLLVEKYGTLKDVVGPAVKSFFKLFRILGTEAVQETMEAFSGLSQAFFAIGDAGMLTQRDFTAFQTVIRNTFDDLVAGGLKGKDALLALAPDLARLRDMALQYGYTLDQNTQELIDQADAAGLLPPVMEPIENIMGDIRDILVLFVEALGIEVPEAFKKAGAAGEAWFGRTEDSFEVMRANYLQFGKDVAVIWDFAGRAQAGYGQFTRADFRQTARDMGLSQEEIKEFVQKSVKAQRKAYREYEREKRKEARDSELELIDRSRNIRDKQIKHWASIRKHGVDAFEAIMAAGIEAAEQIVAAWGPVGEFMYGNSILPDIQEAGETSFKGVSDAARQSASLTNDAFMNDFFLKAGAQFNPATFASNSVSNGVNSFNDDRIVDQLRKLIASSSKDQTIVVQIGNREFANAVTKVIKDESVDGRTAIDQRNVRIIDK